MSLCQTTVSSIMKATGRYLWVLVPLLGMLGCQHIIQDTITSDRIDATATVKPAAAQGQPTGNHYQAARAAFMNGDKAKADLEVKLALQENPLDAKAHFLLGCLLEQKGETDQAIVGFQRVAAIEPTNPEALYNLGTMLLRRGEPVAAAQLFEKAVLLRPDHLPSYNNLAKAYFMTDLPELAVATYEEVLRRDSSNAIARKNLQLLTKAAGGRDADAKSRLRSESFQQVSAVKSSGDLAAAKPKFLAPRSIDDKTATTKKSGIVLAQAQELRDDKEAIALRELLHDLPYVAVERRAGRLTLTGWTSGPNERTMLDRVLGRPSESPEKKLPGPVDKAPEIPEKKMPGPFRKQPEGPERTFVALAGKLVEVLDLTTDDIGDHNRMIEIDAVIFELVHGPDQTNCGFNFLQLINLNFNYFASHNGNPGTGYTAPAPQYGTVLPPVIGPATGVVAGLSQMSWITSAAANYNVNIANADIQRVALLSQPHLTALSGTQAKSLAGGELIYRVSGLNTGDIRPYSFGTTLNVTPTLLRSPAEDGRPRVNVSVELGRSSLLSVLTNLDPNLPTVFDKLIVNSQATLSLGQTLILSGLSQREQRTEKNGVPGLMSIPVLKYLFSTETKLESKTAIVVLLTPRDPAFAGQQNRLAIQEFIEKRRAFILARQGTEEDMRCFKERYPDWDQLPPNRFVTHVILTQTSEFFRTVTGAELSSDDIDLELLGSSGGKKGNR
jgi:Flp pilus assembly protein TadD